MIKRFSSLIAIAAMLSGCMTTGEAYRSDVYTTYDLNQAQEVRSVQIIAVLPHGERSLFQNVTAR